MAMAQSFPDDNTVLWIVTSLPIMGYGAWLIECIATVSHHRAAHIFPSYFNLIRQGAPAMYMFIVKRMQVALASDVAVVTFTYECVAGSEVMMSVLSTQPRDWLGRTFKK